MSGSPVPGRRDAIRPNAERRSHRAPGRPRVRGWALRRFLVAAMLAALATVLTVGGLAKLGPGVPTSRQTPRASGSAPPTASTGAQSPSASPALNARSAAEDACVSTTLTRMSTAEKSGQVLMIGTPSTAPGALRGAVARYHLGAVFLSGKTTQRAAALKQGIGELQAVVRGSGIRLHISVDQEGGEVQSLRGRSFPPVPAALDQGRLSQPRLVKLTVDWTKRVAAAGVTLDLAPVADTVPPGTAAENPPIGQSDRQYGSQPTQVAQDIATVVAAARSAGLMTTLKHFPGLGRVRQNTDLSARAVDRTTTAKDPYLAPFKSGVAAGVAAVMISSASYPALDRDNIAAFSRPVITGLLREQLGFTGLIVSDDLGRAVAVQSIPLGARAVRFINAGGDVVLSVRPQDAAPMYAALLAAARTSAAFRGRLTEAARHMLESKYQAGLLAC